MKKITFTKSYLYNEYIINKKSSIQIGNENNCSETTIRTKLKSFNIKLRSPFQHCTGKTHPNYKHGKLCLDKKYFCKDCGTKVSSGSAVYGNQRCRKCKRKHQKLDTSGKNNGMYGRSGNKNPMYGKTCPHAKWCYYKKYSFRSTYELKFAHFLDCSGIKWEYEVKRFYLKNTSYLPDFYLPDFDCWIEIKGWWRDKDKLKFSNFLKKYKNLHCHVFMKQQLEMIGAL